jgi:hypothetical protein
MGSAVPPPQAGQDTMLREVILEFGRHLDMLAEQLGASLSEADRDAKSVGDSFHDLSAAKAAIEAVVCPEPGRQVLQDSCGKIGRSLHTAVVALQYHDRLAQRLGLVRGGLDRLQALLHEPAPRSYDTWLQSLRDVEQMNRTDQKRLGPVSLPSGSPQPPAAADSSIELF